MFLYEHRTAKKRESDKLTKALPRIGYKAGGNGQSKVRATSADSSLKKRRKEKKHVFEASLRMLGERKGRVIGLYCTKYRDIFFTE